LDIDLRESAIDRSLGELNNLQNNVVTEKERFNDLRTAFEARINELQNIANDARLRKVQQAVESMQPKLAKDQLLRWFDGGNKADVVAILGSMSPERQKKIIGEFKSEEDKAALNKILNEIRAGRAENELLDTANSQLQDITPN
jgi:Mg/Co/Ni transporter MgtE